MKQHLKIIFYSLIIVFILLLFLFLMSFSFERTFFPLIAFFGFTFLILGIVLTILARKEKGKFKIFLMLTGICAIAPFVFTILHNFFYGLAINFENLRFLFEALHVASFIISMAIAPIVFIVGVIGSIILLKSKSVQK